MHLHVIAFATHAEGWFPALRASCVRHGLPLTVLGWGEPWEGYMHKVRALQAHLSTLPDDAMVLVLDAYDVLVLQDEATLLDRFAHLTLGDPGERVVIGVDNPNRHPWHAVFVWLQFGTCDRHTLNAGNYMGTARCVRRLLALVPYSRSEADDQTEINRQCAVHYDDFHRLVVVDAAGWLIFNAYGPTSRWGPGHLHPHTLENKQTGRVPGILHGPGRVDLDPYCSRLGLPRGMGRRRRPLFHPSFYWRTKLTLVAVAVVCLWTVALLLVLAARGANCRGNAAAPPPP